MTNPSEILELDLAERKAIRKDFKEERSSKDKELKDVRDRELNRERSFQEVIVKASASIAEHKTRVQMTSKFTHSVMEYSELLTQCNKQIANLDCQIELKRNELKPLFLEVNKLEDDVSKLFFLYQDKNRTFDKKFSEIKVLLLEKDIMKEGQAVKVIYRKKHELEELEEQLIDIEIKTLNRELERLNKTIDLQPKQDGLNEMVLSLEFLRNEKSQKELSGLFSAVSGTNMNSNNSVASLDQGELIEANVVEEANARGRLNHNDPHKAND